MNSTGESGTLTRPVKNDKIVVLGAGPAGMSAAWRLSQLGYPVTVLERDGAVGGMGKTIEVGKYAVDYGPHTFHIRETEESRAIHEAIKPLFGDDPLILTRGTRVLLRGKEYVYPLEMLQVLTGVSPLLSARIVFDDRSLRCVRTEPSEAIAIQRPLLFDQVRRRAQRGGTQPDVQLERVEGLIASLRHAEKQTHGGEGRDQKCSENHTVILAKQDRDHKPRFVDFHPLLL